MIYLKNIIENGVFMNKFFTVKLLLATVVLSALSACSSSHKDIKSPCVGAEGSPCDRRPVNNNNA